MPSESEWEYAARGGTTTARYWGDGIAPARANYRGSGNDHTVEVGRYAANPFGLHDMLGNVSEWVEDCWHPSYEGAPKSAQVWLGGDCNRNVLRGGSWVIDPWGLRSANRNWREPSRRSTYLGFRVARTLP